jgi:hypothetical protein
MTQNNPSKQASGAFKALFACDTSIKWLKGPCQLGSAGAQAAAESISSEPAKCTYAASVTEHLIHGTQHRK